MTNAYNSQVGWPDEKVSTPFNATYQALSTPLTFNPVIIIFDNQSDGDVEISLNGTSTWKTFSAGEALVLDLRANHGRPSEYTPSIGTQIYCKSAAPTTGIFRVSFTS